jgi:hypothetical protein
MSSLLFNFCKMYKYWIRLYQNVSSTLDNSLSQNTSFGEYHGIYLAFPSVLLFSKILLQHGSRWRLTRERGKTFLCGRLWIPTPGLGLIWPNDVNQVFADFGDW